MGGEELEIGLSRISYPISAGSPIVHETGKDYGLVSTHVSLRKLDVT